MDKPQRLSDKIKQMEQQVGLVPMVCIETGCEYVEKNPVIGRGHYGRQHCRETIPLMREVRGELKLIDLCSYKIEEYWK